MHLVFLLDFSNATPFTHGSDHVSFTNTSAVATGTSGAEFVPFTDTGRTIYATDPYREPNELYANPGPPAPDFAAHVRKYSRLLYFNLLRNYLCSIPMTKFVVQNVFSHFSYPDLPQIFNLCNTTIKVGVRFNLLQVVQTETELQLVVQTQE